MNYVGIDAGRKHWVCILDEQQRDVVPRFCIQNLRADYERLAALAGKDAKMCIEDTGSYSLPIYEYFKTRGYDIILIKGLRAKRLRDFLKDSWKTDLVDCHVLALVRALESSLPSTDLVSHTTQGNLKPLVRLYCAHARHRAELKQKLVAIIQRTYPELTDTFYEATCETVLGIIRWTTAADWNAPKHVLALLKDHDIQPSRDDVKRALLCLTNTVGVPAAVDDSLHFLIDAYWSQARFLADLELQLARALLRTPYATLVTLPSIGLITTAVLVAEVADVTRFSNPKKFVKYCGFRFRREQSGDTDLHKLKSVATPIRWVLSSVVLNVMKYDPKLKLFAERLRKRGKKPLVIRFAVARKLLVRLYFELKKRHSMTLADNIQALTNAKTPPAIRKALQELMPEGARSPGAEQVLSHATA
jgi:transposase